MELIERKFKVHSHEAYTTLFGHSKVQVTAIGDEGETITFLVSNDNVPPIHSFVVLNIMSE